MPLAKSFPSDTSYPCGEAHDLVPSHPELKLVELFPPSFTGATGHQIGSISVFLFRINKKQKKKKEVATPTALVIYK